MENEEPFNRDEITSEEIEQALMRLYLRGILKIEYDENLEARFSLAEQPEKSEEPSE